MNYLALVVAFVFASPVFASDWSYSCDITHILNCRNSICGISEVTHTLTLTEKEVVYTFQDSSLIGTPKFESSLDQRYVIFSVKVEGQSQGEQISKHIVGSILTDDNSFTATADVGIVGYDYLSGTCK